MLEESIALAYEDRKNVRAAERLGLKSFEENSRLASLFKECAIKSLAEASATQATSLYLVAADLFVSARRPQLAAECLESAGEYERAAKLFLQAGDTDDAVRIVIKRKIEGTVKDDVWFAAR